MNKNNTKLRCLGALTAVVLFITASAYASSRTAIDFNDPADANLWTPLAGLWTTVTGGKYVGIGPNQDPFCPYHLSPTYLKNFKEKNVELSVDLLSPDDQIDKIIFLRSTADMCNRSEIELNFRSDPYNDIAVVETVNNSQQILRFYPLI